MFSVRCLILE